MTRTQKDPQGRELDDDDDLRDAPRVDESEVEDEERARVSLEKPGTRAEQRESDESHMDDEEHDELAEEIRVEDLAAMEGPDA